MGVNQSLDELLHASESDGGLVVLSMRAHANQVILQVITLKDGAMAKHLEAGLLAAGNWVKEDMQRTLLEYADMSVKN